MARRSERELLVLFGRDRRRLLGNENDNGSRIGWNSANNGFRDVQGLVNEISITILE